NGNRTLGVNSAAGTSYTGTYDDQDRLLSYGPYDYTYTANGELETKTNRESGQEWIFAYDALGNLLSVGLPNGDLVEYLVDGMGRRVGKKKNGVLQKQWLYRNALKPVAELDGSGNLVSEFVYGSKSNVPDYVRRGGATYRVISDQLGSPRYVVNVANASDVPFTATYTSFGVVTGTGLDWMPFGFAGGIYDGDSGVIRYGRRDFDPTIGRWVSKEPLRFRAGKNFYVYAFNDPINLFDPTGREPTGAGGASGQGEGGSEGTGSGGGYSPAPPGSGYTDYNITAGIGVGVTGGLFLDQYGQVHPYFGGGLMTPGICGSVNESITGSVSPDERSEQYSISGLGSDAAIGYGGGDWFTESGSAYPPTPGQSITLYYTW
ncbi:MAG TPA: RHS repeat-associated core domain-containing protein, partial [Polyangiaceae bacterium]|nr:RHS repeat-associated core domain-containing protein [Polyangiaceae bacterium]